MKPFLAVADIDDGTFAVLSIDPTQRVGTGCKAIVMSVHETRRDAETALQESNHEQK